ncbi:MAG: PilW family protein [Mariprofundus sp.]
MSSAIQTQHKAPAYNRSGEHGFTLLEMLIGLGMGLVILAGITAVFISINKTSSTMSSRTERMGDLFLVSQLMQSDLRGSLKKQHPDIKIRDDLGPPRNATIPPNYPTTFDQLPHWDPTSQTLTYQTLEGRVGIFHYQHKGKNDIYWLRPDASIFQELIRDLDPVNGMAVTPIGNGGIHVILRSVYNNEQHSGKETSIAFNVWPRN